MAKGQRDLYQVWKDNGEFDIIVAFIKDCYKKLVTQREMCEHLNISEVTFSRMKKKHPDIATLVEASRLDLKRDLVGALYKRAMGYSTVETQQIIEDTGKGNQQKRRVLKIEREVGPDYKSIVYLLTKHFGREYSERYEEIKQVANTLNSEQPTSLEFKITNQEDKGRLEKLESEICGKNSDS